MRLAPHTDRMKKGSSWEGYALSNPPRGRGLGARASGPRPRGNGETRFPHSPRREPMFTLALHAAPAAQRRNEKKVILGRAAPSQTLPGAAAWVRGPPARIRNGIKKIVPGRATPSQTLPPGGGMGKPGFPTPLRTGYALPDPPTGWGDRETGFPHPPAHGLRPPRPSRGRGRGETRFPHTSLRELMFTLAHRATLRASPQRCRNAALPAPRRHWPGGPLLAVRCRRPAPWSPRPRRYPLPRSCRRPR